MKWKIYCYRCNRKEVKFMGNLCLQCQKAQKLVDDFITDLRKLVKRPLNRNN